MDKDESFRHEYAFKRRAISELYSGDDKKLMLEKLSNCKTISQMENVMVWGRVHIMKGNAKNGK